MKALITGATGFIGRALARRLQGCAVLTRDAAKARTILGNVEVHEWEPTLRPAPAAAFAGVDVVFNLMGDPIAKGRWNPEKLKRIRESRVIGTRNLVLGMAQAGGPKALVSASAIGFYGSRGDQYLDEQSAPGNDFLAGVCKEWEAEARVAAANGVRVVVIRNGIVLRKEGGALAEMMTPFKLGLGGRLGSGRQWMSWIHLDDLLALYLMAADRNDAPGTMNGVSPGAVTNKEFTLALATALRIPAILPMPEFAIKLAFGGVAEVMLGSQRVSPRAAEGAGFKFQHPEIYDALRMIVADR
jgi:hypothetical protein